jgi:hypothetical protein
MVLASTTTSKTKYTVRQSSESMSSDTQYHIWRYQPHFRLMVESTIESALTTIGAGPLRPVVVVIGIADDDIQARQVVVEPDNTRLAMLAESSQAHRSGPSKVSSRVSAVIDSQGGIHRNHYQDLTHQQRASQLADVLNTSGAYPDRTFLVSSSAPINGYHVHTCIGLDTGTLEGLDELSGPELDRRPVAQSLPVEVVQQVLRMSDALLATQDPGHGFWPAGLTNYDIVRRSARQVVEGCAVRSGALSVTTLFDRLDTITSQHYEGAAASGRLVLARRGHAAVQVAVKLKEPIPVGYYRSLRKLLETTDDEVAMLCDGEEVFGLGSVVGYDQTAQDLFEIEVAAHATWKLSHGGRPIMQVEYGKAALPKPAVSRSVFDNTMRLRFPTATQGDIDRTWQSVKATVQASHGSILVITTDAMSEANRLAGQATLVDPVVVDTELIKHITKIDGAVLLDPSGVCYAIGVILDGTASSSGDPSRGARFNSALRYLETQECPAVAVVVSSDGDVHVLPRLRSRINRTTVDQAVEQLLLIASLDHDPEAFARAWQELEEVAFYLTKEQCDLANSAVSRYEQFQSERGEPAHRHSVLRPQSDMDSAYLIDDGIR